MSDANPTLKWIDELRQRFLKTCECFEPDDAAFVPKPGMMSVVAQVAHTAHTVDWFVGPTFKGEPFDLDFEKLAQEAAAVTELADAYAWLDRAFDDLKGHVAQLSPPQLNDPQIPADSPIMPGATINMILCAIEDHTAHHRGSLAVYARLLGREPAMPYL